MNRNRETTVAAVLLFVVALLSACQKSLPNPIASFPFNISKEGTVVDGEFTIPTYRSWIFGITLLPADEKVRTATSGFHGFDWGQPDASKLLPVHLTIQEFYLKTYSYRTIFSERIPTVEPGSAGLVNDSGILFIRANLISINLSPGLYRVRATTEIDNPTFVGIKSFLTINYHPYVGTWPSAINPERIN